MKNTIYNLLTARNIFLITLFIFAFSERVFFDLGPNVELVTAAIVLSSFYLGVRSSFWLTFLIMLFSDLVIGNTNIFLFTWTGFLVPALFARSFYLNTNPLTKVFRGTLAGISTTGFFFIWTNFGVWLLSSMYPKNGFGLIMSYVNALPFLRYQAISTIIFVPLGIVLVEFAVLLNKKFEFEKRISRVTVLS